MAAQRSRVEALALFKRRRGTQSLRVLGNFRATGTCFSGRMSPDRGKNGRFRCRPALAQKLLSPKRLPQTTGRNNTESGPHTAERFHQAYCDALLACARHKDKLADGGMIRSYHYGAVIADMTDSFTLTFPANAQGAPVEREGDYTWTLKRRFAS